MAISGPAARSCNSACPYLILGATTREIAPDTRACGAFAESGRAFPRRRADPADAGRGDATRHRTRRSHAVEICLQDGRRGRAAGSRKQRQIRRACTSSPARRLPASASTGATSSRRRGRSRTAAAAWCARSAIQKNAPGEFLPHVAVAAVLLHRRPVRTRLPAAGAGHRGASPTVSISTGAAKPLNFTFRAGKVGRIRGLGAAHEPRVDPVAGRFATVRLHRDLAGAGWAAAGSLREILHRRPVRRADEPARRPARRERTCLQRTWSQRTWLQRTWLQRT